MAKSMQQRCRLPQQPLAVPQGAISRSLNDALDGAGCYQKPALSVIQTKKRAA
jgi:hypothetical protein